MPAETYAEDDDVYRWGVFHYKDGLLKVNPSACSHNRIGDGKYEVTIGERTILFLGVKDVRRLEWQKRALHAARKFIANLP